MHDYWNYQSETEDNPPEPLWWERLIRWLESPMRRHRRWQIERRRAQRRVQAWRGWCSELCYAAESKGFRVELGGFGYSSLQIKVFDQDGHLVEEDRLGD